ncbi:MAG: dihydrofolate reductase family protein [Proteobacteria bacterium]|nr:dihydrofolate reductase family protein [Pseudomonadota bacterium]
MRPLILSQFMSLDGYTCAEDGTFLPPPWSDEVAENWSHYALGRATHLVYGRVNFLFNKGFWEAAETDPNSIAAKIPYAGTMNKLPKTVFSRTLTGDPGWNGKLAGPDLKSEITALKQCEGAIFCFGGAKLAQSLIAADVIDEYFVMITPNLLGRGKRLFESGFSPIDLSLERSKQLDTGAVILHYRRKSTS